VHKGLHRFRCATGGLNHDFVETAGKIAARSNMESCARIETFEYDHPKQSPTHPIIP
jgi:hypothetical protein